MREAFRSADALYMSRRGGRLAPQARRLAGKWRKKDDGTRDAPRIELVRNPDILATLGRSQGRSRLVVGFALETGDGERRALAKMRRKNLDYVVLNDETALNARRTTVTILGRDGTRKTLRSRSKRDVARVLVAFAAQRQPV